MVQSGRFICPKLALTELSVLIHRSTRRGSLPGCVSDTQEKGIWGYWGGRTGSSGACQTASNPIPTGLQMAGLWHSRSLSATASPGPVPLVSYTETGVKVQSQKNQGSKAIGLGEG